ncbi:MAG: nucleotidyltransferase family protein [Anaerolineales bacterium]
MEVSPAAMEAYIQTARARKLARQQRLEQRRTQAWAVAQHAAVVLKEEFGATRVGVFGSLLHPDLFYERSDVDLAVWGLDERLYHRAHARLLSLDPTLEVDLIEVEHARPALQAVIEREGVIL